MKKNNEQKDRYTINEITTAVMDGIDDFFNEIIDDNHKHETAMMKLSLTSSILQKLLEGEE